MNKENIKPAEVSDILLAELQQADLTARYAEVGTVLQVVDGVVRIYGLQNAEANELLEFDNGIKAVVMNLEEDNVGAVLLGSTEGLKGWTVAIGNTGASLALGAFLNDLINFIILAFVIYLVIKLLKLDVKK